MRNHLSSAYRQLYSSTSNNTLDYILCRLDRVRCSSQNQWMACCPAHDDKSPSLSIKATDEGKILLYCFAGCSTQDIVDSLGLRMTDLFPPQTEQEIQERRRQGHRELYEKEVFIANIALADTQAGKTLSDVDADRARLALERMEKLEKLYGGRP